MKKVLFILHLPPPVHGSSVMGKAIRDSEIINEKINSRFINFGTSKTMDEIGKNPFKKVFLYLKIIFQVTKNMIMFNPDLVYLAITVKGLGFYKDAVVVSIVKSFSRKTVYHLHNKGVALYHDNWFDDMLYKYVFSNAEIILLSKNLYPDIKKYVPAERVHYCPNGIPVSEFLKSDKAEEKMHPNAPIKMLFLSNLMKAKGVFVLLEACKILKGRQLNFQCTFVGGESDITAEGFQQKVQELSIAECVVYSGKKYGKEKEESFSEADIFVFPTLNETFGLVNLEAMQFSLPIVSTFEGGIPDVVEDGTTGFLVEKNNASALAEKLDILIKNPELCREMGRKGREKFEKYYTMDAFEKCFSMIISEIMEKEIK